MLAFSTLKFFPLITVLFDTHVDCIYKAGERKGLLAVALPSLFHNPPPHWVCQSPSCCKSSPPRLSISAPPTGLDECFFFNSLAFRLPYSSIFWQFWLFFVFKFVLILLLLVRGGTVCLPMPPAWPGVLGSPHFLKDFFTILLNKDLMRRRAKIWVKQNLEPFIQTQRTI